MDCLGCIPLLLNSDMTGNNYLDSELLSLGVFHIYFEFQSQCTVIVMVIPSGHITYSLSAEILMFELQEIFELIACVLTSIRKIQLSLLEDNRFLVDRRFL